MKKITKKEMFLKAIANTTDEELIAFFNHEIELLDNKAKRSAEATRKPTKTQVANEELKNKIVDYLSSVSSATIAEIKDKFDLSSQKITPLVNALVDENRATKVVEKRVAHYSKV